MAHDPSNLQRAKFADRLRTARKARGFRTARSFAEKVGVDQNTYTRYERGEVEPNVGLIERMWQALDLPPTDLFGVLPSGGLAEPVTPPLSGAATGQLSGPTESALAWQVAETFIAARAAPGAALGPLDALRAAARIYAELAADPFGAVARLVADPDLERGDPNRRDALVRRIGALTGALSGRDARLKRPRDV